MGSDLSAPRPAESMPVVLGAGEDASGLAEMLQQFLEQTLAASPRTAQRARRLSGAAVFRAAEDEAVAVRMRFAGDRIELDDGVAAGAVDPTITADFLTIAHLASGQESLVRLLVGRRLRARFSPRDVPFLLGVLRLMQTRAEARPASGPIRLRRLWPVALAVAGGGAVWWWATRAP